MKKEEEKNYDLSAVGDAPQLAAILPAPEDEKGNPDPSENSEPSESSDSSDNSDSSESSDSSDSSDSSEPSELSDAPNPPLRPTLEAVLRLASALLSGETLPDDLLPIMTAAGARAAIEAARAEGELAGRNAQIEEKLALPDDIGAPDLVGQPAPAARRPASSIFDLADMAR